MFSSPVGTSPENQIGLRRRRLRVRVGPSLDTLETCDVNNEQNPHFIDSPHFTGNILVRIKDFKGVTPHGGAPKRSDAYFGDKKRNFSVQVQGRFKHVHQA
jgi:Protein of unknown function (DUF1769)